MITIGFIAWSVGIFFLGCAYSQWRMRKDIHKMVSQRYDAEARKDTMKYLSQFELLMVKKEEGNG